MDGLSLTTAGWVVLAVIVLALLAVVVRYFISVAMEFTRVLLVAGGLLIVAFVVWVLFYLFSCFFQPLAHAQKCAHLLC